MVAFWDSYTLSLISLDENLLSHESFLNFLDFIPIHAWLICCHTVSYLAIPVGQFDWLFFFFKQRTKGQSGTIQKWKREERQKKCDSNNTSFAFQEYLRLKQAQWRQQLYVSPFLVYFLLDFWLFKLNNVMEDPCILKVQWGQPSPWIPVKPTVLVPTAFL